MKKELVKPSSIKKRTEKEVESLCDGFSCGTFSGDAWGDTGNNSDILF